MRFTSLLPLIALPFALCAHAEIHASYKHFGAQKEGLWETTTTLLEGTPNVEPVKETVCINYASMEKSAQIFASMSAQSNQITQCKTKVTVDTKDHAESVQNCDMGIIKTNTVMQMDRVDNDTIKTTTDMTNAGAHIKSVSVSHYLRPCTIDDKIPPARPGHEKDCEKMEENIIKMKAECKVQSGQNAMLCSTILPQFEAIQAMHHCK